MKFDILIHGGEVMDPGGGLEGRFDVGIRRDKIVAVAPDLPIPMDKIAWIQNQLVGLGQIPRAGDLSQMVNTEIRAEAMKRVGN